MGGVHSDFNSNATQWRAFSVHKTPFSEATISSQDPHFANPSRTPLPEKKLSAPWGGLNKTSKINQYAYLICLLETYQIFFYFL